MESKFLVSMEGDPEKRSISHYHYTDWPDFGTPPTHSLVDLVRRVGASKPGKPMVVHCSAGLGRTGAFATVHSCLECHVDRRHVDVKEKVQSLRQNRKGMVQTTHQYRVCYETIAEALLPAERDREQEREQTPQPDFRPTSVPPPPYQEKEIVAEPTPPPPPTSPPPAFSEPSTPVKEALVETPPNAVTPPPSATHVEGKQRPQAATPSRPPSGESEGVRRKVLDGAQPVEVEAVVDVERKKSATGREMAEAGSMEPGRSESAEKRDTQALKAEPKEVAQPTKTEASSKKAPPKTETSPKAAREQRIGGAGVLGVVPEVMITAPSTEHVDQIGTDEDEPPPPPTSPPPVDFPSSQEESGQPEATQEGESEENGGFSIGDDQVIIEKPYEKGDELKHIKKDIPKNTPKWKHQPVKTAPPQTSSATTPKWKILQQQRAEEAKKKSTPAKVVVPPIAKVDVPARVAAKETSASSSPRKVGKINIPSIFGGGGASPSPSPEHKPFPLRANTPVNTSPSRVELAKTSNAQPTPPSSPAPRKKWTVPSAPSPEKEEERATGNTPPALRKLKELQRKGNQTALTSSPVYKLPTMTSPKKQSAPPPQSGSKDTTMDHSDSKPSSSSVHSTDTGMGNVARLLAKFQ